MSGVAVLSITIVMVCNSVFRGWSGGSSGEIDCTLGSDHTMCKYSGPASGCTPGQLTSGERDEIIKVHNNLRATVASGKETRSKTGQSQPNASNMLRMKYDDELAKVAQRWAEQCTSGHDKNRKDKRFGVGQNFASQGNSDPSFKFPIKEMITAWYDEVKVFDPSIVSSFRSTSDKIGHYTQVVWHDSGLVGCGYSTSYKGDGKLKMKQFILVCNYGPAGNTLSREIYKVGSPCSDCPSDHSSCSDSLCG